MAKKSDGTEVAHRVGEVLRILLGGAQHHDVVQFASEQGWGVSERQVRTYVSRATDLLVERQDRSRRRAVAKHVAQREALFARALSAGDLRTALAVLADLAKLRGLYASGNDVKELVKLAAAQGVRIEELERRIRDSGLTPPQAQGTRPAAGPAGADAARAGGPAGGVPGGPGPADG